MTFDDIKYMPVGELIGCKVSFLYLRTRRKRQGTITLVTAHQCRISTADRMAVYCAWEHVTIL